ncbi:hypothetical protein Q9L58_004135 [Maublancomyces gigas]|uniref:Uncharacterized protein n=1 Tax=Discina gigas TaxID=1032678 RepID=A0ABR3GLW0_9PEZI
MTASILQPFVAALVHSATNSSPALRNRYRRDNGDGSLGPSEIISFFGALLGLFVAIPGLVVVCIQARKYWRRRTRKNAPDVELGTAISENLNEPISSAGRASTWPRASIDITEHEAIHSE